jgi:phage-related baseplate assembly protein
MTFTLPFPEPSFIDRDPNKVLNDQVLQWETLTGKTLYPAQVEQLLINLIAYREILTRIGIQEAAKQNLVEYATYPMLDHLGELVGTYRLLPAPATCFVQFSIDEVRTADVAIPAKTQVYAGSIVFETDVDCLIKAGELQVVVSATALDVGTSRNGVMPGVLTNLGNLEVEGTVFVSNLTITDGGLDLEDDARFRSRIKLAPNRFSSAGPIAAYEYFSMSVRQDIIYTGIYSPAPGVVKVYPLLVSGLPDQQLLVKIFDALNDSRVRPLTDDLQVATPIQKDYSVTMHVKLHVGAPEASTLQAVEMSLTQYALSLQRVLGRELVASQWEGVASSTPGVYRVWCDLPEESASATPGDWLHNTGIDVVFEGFDSPPH